MGDVRRKRLEGLRSRMSGAGVAALLVTDLKNVSYLTGFTGSSGFVLVTETASYFITDFRYKTQSAQEVQGYEVVIQKGRWTHDVSALVRDEGVGSLGFEGRSMTFDVHAALSEALSGVGLVPVKEAVEGLRLIKDADELKRIREAIRRAEQGFMENLPRVAPGIAEREVALGLDYNIMKQGALKPPFDTIVASGPRAALPHGIASDREMEEGDTVVIDFGGEADGYQCDLTRSGVLGEPDKKQSEVYDIVAEAQRRAIAAVKPGVPCRDVDAAARDYIKSKGYGDYFGHGLGHGVGLDVHEAPGISPMGEGAVAEGMVFTIEPGIYLPGWGGFRIEDMVLATAGGCEVITSLPRRIGLR